MKDDGWIKWHGGEYPVPAGTLVDYRLRNGMIGPGTTAADVEWRRMGAVYDIVAYRISKPDTSAEETRLWHEYAGRAMLGLMDAAMSGDEIARCAADMADAMLTEARKRGRV